VTRDQEALLRKARESVDAARLLAGEGHAEFAASRTYYAMFYVAEAFLLARGLRFSKHSAVHAAFGRDFVKAGHLPADMHRELLEAARIRNLGDYDIETVVDPEVARELISQAEAFIRTAEDRIDTLPTPAGDPAQPDSST